MSHRQLLAIFEFEDDLLTATSGVRQQGLTIVDAYTPYAVHGLDQAMGLKPSRLTWVCFVGGMLGAAGMLWFEHWTASVDWAINVGGKPWNSLPSDVPVAFEAAVGIAGFATVFALFAVSRLYPGKQSPQPQARTSDDQFVLVIEQTDAAFDAPKTTTFLKSCGAVHVEEQVAAGGDRS
jgi:Alternative complex III, ActD subunit